MNDNIRRAPGQRRYTRSSIVVALSVIALILLVTPATEAQATNDQASTAQDGGEPCYTQILFERKLAKSGASTSACPGQGPCDDPSVRDSWIPAPEDPPLIINVYFHVFRNDDGSNAAATAQNVEGAVLAMNQHFEPWRIQFEYEMRFVNDTRYRQIGSFAEFDAMKNLYALKPDSQCNVYVVEVNVNGDVFSFATFPWDPDALTSGGGIVMNRTQFPPFGAATMSHEMGHCLGLWHTHHGVSEVVPCSGCYESPGAGNRDITGDLCSDTDPTPTNFTCAGPGGSDSCSGNAWGPTDPQNFMGYGPQSCRTEFTEQQGGRMQCWTNDVLTSWLSNVQFVADVNVGEIPLDVTFTAETAKNVLTWDWDFGDGGAASVQNPSHTYSDPGVYDVQVSIEATDGTFETRRNDYILAHADTVIGDQPSVSAGEQVRLDIYARNYVPLTVLQIPFAWGGSLNLTYDSVSTVGLRTEYMPSQFLKNFDPFNSRATYVMKAIDEPKLSPDTGAVLSLYFTVPDGAAPGTNPVVIESYSSNALEFVTDAGPYTPNSIDGAVDVSDCRPGDIDNDGVGPNIADLTFFVNYLFKGGTQPEVIEAANVDGAGAINVADLTYFVSFFFKDGPALVCAPLQS